MMWRIPRNVIVLACMALCYGNAAYSADIEIRVPDGVTSWTELKLYQTRTLRNVNMSCLGRYEKTFKPGSSENMALMAAGGEWARVIIQKCPKQSNGKCTYMSLKEYKDQGAGNDSSNSYTIPQTKLEGWPLSWRGYLADDNEDNQFPNFGKDGGGSGGSNKPSPLDRIKKLFSGGGNSGGTTGLDNAQLGDLILLPKGASGKGQKPGLAKVVLVSEVNLPRTGDCETRKDCYVQVIEGDNGKWPDVCGTTDTNGAMKTRYYYKPGNLPEPVQKEYEQIKSTESCEDTKLGRCVFELWDDAKLYRIREDDRKGCDKEHASECGEDNQ